jgi:hypothetical protein
VLKGSRRAGLKVVSTAVQMVGLKDFRMADRKESMKALLWGFEMVDTSVVR